MAAPSDPLAVNGTWLRRALHAIALARLDRPPRSPYGRLELVDVYGQEAWTNPLWN